MSPSDPTGPPTIVVILGPTAAGKSDLAAALALAMDGEVVGADSMQVYCGLDAGTAKPDAATRARVPHH
ncbi:MAG: isopentenyl transferase family protein, partial [Acidobacteriota bacterium]